MFSLLLIVFHLIEEVLVGVWKRKAVLDSLAGKSVLEFVVLAVIMFFVLMPFFALMELARDVGGDKLFEQFFLRRTRSSPRQ